MSINTTAQISDPYIQTIFEDALFVARDNNLIANLVTVFSDRNDDSPRSSSEHAQVTINAIDEADDLASQAFTPSVLSTLTPQEYGAQYLLTDRRRASDPFGVQQAAAQELGMGIATDIESKVLAQFGNLTGGTIGTAGSAPIWGHFFAALTHLRAQNAPGPYYYVVRPEQWHDLAQAASVAGAQVVNAPEFQDEIMRRWYVGTVAGVQVFTSTNIVKDANDDATGAMFNRTALALDIRRAPRLEPERDASRRAIELNMTVHYATGVWRPKFGVQVIGDASLPSF